MTLKLPSPMTTLQEPESSGKASQLALTAAANVPGNRPRGHTPRNMSSDKSHAIRDAPAGHDMEASSGVAPSSRICALANSVRGNAEVMACQ